MWKWSSVIEIAPNSTAMKSTPPSLFPLNCFGRRDILMHVNACEHSIYLGRVPHSSVLSFCSLLLSASEFRFYSSLQCVEDGIAFVHLGCFSNHSSQSPPSSNKYNAYLMAKYKNAIHPAKINTSMRLQQKHVNEYLGGWLAPCRLVRMCRPVAWS